MKKFIGSAVLCLAALAQTAAAYNYPLQFAPNTGFRGLVLAGYKFANNQVVGTCSYYTLGAGSGIAGGGRGIKKVWAQTCTWDIYGNLISMTPGAPAAPAPMSFDGTWVTYATNGSGSSTGTDLSLQLGFVNTFGSHFSILDPITASSATQGVNTKTYNLQSDGDEPVNISRVSATSAAGASVSVSSTTCVGQLAVSTTCTITVSYDASRLAVGAFDTLHVYITSDAPGSHDIIQPFTVQHQ